MRASLWPFAWHSGRVATSIKIAQNGRAAVRAEIIRLTLASAAKLPEGALKGPVGPAQPALDADAVMQRFVSSCKNAFQQGLA
eukprot:242479-Alexandrium_andersonii.AAC.1